MGNLVEVPGVSPLRQSHPFLNSWLDCNEEQAKDPKLPLQHCFMATVTDGASREPRGGSCPQATIPSPINIQ